MSDDSIGEGACAKFQSLLERLAEGGARLAGMADADRQSLQGKLARTDGEQLVERVMNGDRLFFKRRRRRKYRLRQADRIEIERGETAAALAKRGDQ